MRVILIALLCCAAGAQSLLVNAGGPALPPDTTGTSYQADQSFTGGVVWDDPTIGLGIWETLRYAPQFSYDFHISNGFYTVKIDLIEPNKTGPNQRVFTVTANGIQSDPIDVFAMTGAINKQTSITMLVMVGNGHLRANFQAIIGNAMVSAFEITPATIFSGIQTVSIQLFTCQPPLSDTTCTQVPVQGAMQWFKCAAPCVGINLVHLNLADGTNVNMYAEPVEKSWQFDQRQWATALPGH